MLINRAPQSTYVITKAIQPTSNNREENKSPSFSGFRWGVNLNPKQKDPEKGPTVGFNEEGQLSLMWRGPSLGNVTLGEGKIGDDTQNQNIPGKGKGEGVEIVEQSSRNFGPVKTKRVVIRQDSREGTPFDRQELKKRLQDLI